MQASNELWSHVISTEHARSVQNVSFLILLLRNLHGGDRTQSCWATCRGSALLSSENKTVVLISL